MAAENSDYNKAITDKNEYALTVTFKHLHCKSAKGQFKETAPYLTKILKRSCLFDIVPEFRVHDGSIHYHGRIQIIDRIKWIKETLPSLKRLGFICIKILKDDIKNGWIKYYHKEIDIANAVLGNYFPLMSEISFKKSKPKPNPSIDDLVVEGLIEDT